MRKENSDLQTAFLSELGAQLENKDYFGYVELDDFACWVMADGIDECENKNSGKMLVEEILESFREKPGISGSYLTQYIKDAHSLLQRESIEVRLKASVMVVVTDYMSIRWTSAGNVHLQVVHKNDIRFASLDQSYYQSQVEQGIVPSDRSEGFEERNNLVNYAGTVDKFEPYVSKKHKLKETDSIVLSTVGLWEHVTDVEILDAMTEAETPQEAIDNMEELLLSKQPQELNNYSAAVIFVNKLFLQEKKWWPKVKRILMIAIPIILILAIIGFLYYRSAKKREALITEIEEYEEAGDQYVRDDNYSRALEQYTEGHALLKDAKKYDNEPLEHKKQTAEYIIDGDASSEKDGLEEAKNYYTKARDMMIDYEKDLKDFKYSTIAEKLDLINTRIYIDDLIALGDTQVEAGLYADAVSTYKKAKSSAVSVNDKAAIQDIDVKLETARTMQDTQEAEAAAAEADKAAAEADQAAAEDPDEAADKYDEVADQYEKAGQSDKAAAMRAKAAEIRASEAEAEQKRQEEIAASIAEKGDKALKKESYAEAKSFYESAQKIYMNINSMTGVYNMSQKIAAVEALMIEQTGELSG